MDKFPGWGKEPEDWTDKVFGRAEPVHRGMADDGLTARGQAPGFFVGEQEAVLLRQEEAGGDRVHPDFG